MKKYRIPPEELRPLAMGYGLCMAPDSILVQGMPVRIMYRVMPSRRQDSGWRFLAGNETPSYLRDERYHGIYDVNIVANYSPNIMENLDAPPYSFYELMDDGHWIDLSRCTDFTLLA